MYKDSIFPQVFYSDSRCALFAWFFPKGKENNEGAAWVRVKLYHLYLFFRLAWIGMLSGVVIEKIQEANKISAVYRADDSIDEDRLMKIKVEQEVIENPQNYI